MKNSIITYLLGFFFLITCFKSIANTYDNRDSASCLQVDGKITNANEGEDGFCTIELMSSNRVITSAILKGGKKTFKFLLGRDVTYTIRISKPGYLPRLVCIDTKMDQTEEELYNFSFETKLLSERESTKLNKEYLDFPIALIYYDNKKDCFVYDKSYTSKIKKEIVMK
ncbi:hypothetical protein [Aurantibacillus circumpalustris]|uniref:hypothetical protein n=1 Tax=Aurantibacillus circumpalustris TaxID=3036359 RepID=UPI00295A8DAE|nr:hypothetical protein [Aurantibacillus circumpalustris]